MPSSNGFLRAETETYFRERRDAQELVVACNLRGKISRRMVRNLNSFVSSELTSEDQEEIEVQRLRRMRLIGIDEEAA